MDLHILEEIGMTKGEAKVYLSLFSLGLTTTGPIVRESGVSASKVYKVLERLAQKGLVSHVVKNRTKFFQAADPERLLDFLELREKKIALEKKSLEKLIPELKKKRGSLSKAQSVEVFEGIEGIKTARTKLMNELEKGDQVNILGVSKESQTTLKGFWTQGTKVRIKKGVKSRMLFDRTAPEKFVKESNSLPLTNAKFLSPEFISPSWFVVGQNFVQLGVQSEKHVSILIRNEKISESFRQYFDSLWNKRWAYIEGEEGVKYYLELGMASLKKGQTWFVLNSARPHPKSEDILRELHRRRAEKGIKLKITYSEEMGDLVKLRLESGLAEVRVLPKVFANPASIALFADYVVIQIWTLKPKTFILKDKELHNAFRKYFDILWSIAKPLKSAK